MIFPSIQSILAGLVFGVLVASAAYYAKALTSSGAISAAILGTLILGLGGWSWAVILLLFFVSSSLLSYAFKGKKTILVEKHSKGHRRDSWQVIANGGAAGVFVVLHSIFPDNPHIWAAFCASLAAANADTWATELGAISKTLPRLVSNWKQVEMGTSGGVTLIGTLSAVAGALVIGLGAFIFQPNVLLIPVVTIAGLLGSLVDSLLGATIQAGYKCSKCNKETEKYPTHSCGGQTILIRGISWLNNDWVNLTCTITGGILGYFFITL